MPVGVVVISDVPASDRFHLVRTISFIRNVEPQDGTPFAAK